MQTLVYVIVGILVAIALVSSGYATAQYKSKGNTGIPWVKIRPILTDMFVDINQVIEAKDKGYETIEEFAVEYVYNKVQNAVFLSPIEKGFITESLIRNLIAPRLKELYNKDRGQ